MAEREIVAPVGVQCITPLAVAESPAGGAGVSFAKPGLSPGKGHRRRAADFLGGVLAMLLLPLSIAPVLLLGPSVLRAPVALSREAWGDVQRLERDLRPARGARPAFDALELRGLPAVSLGPVYGRWAAFPQAGRTLPGDPQLGPEEPSL